MSAITFATVVSITDKEAVVLLKALGTDGSGYGIGTTGASARAYGKAKEVEGIITTLADDDQNALLAPGARAQRLALDAYALMKEPMKSFLSGLNESCRQAGIVGVSDLDTFAAYYNLTTVTKWQCLLCPDFATAYYAAMQKRLTAYNVYFEVLQSVYTNGLRKLVVSGAVQTAGQDIDSTLYAGGFGQINVTAITGSGVVTVAGTWRRPDGTTFTGNGTATATTTGVVVLTPPETDALLISVSGITVAAGITAGTIYAEAKRPSGRTNPPT